MHNLLFSSSVFFFFLKRRNFIVHSAETCNASQHFYFENLFSIEHLPHNTNSSLIPVLVTGFSLCLPNNQTCILRVKTQSPFSTECTAEALNVVLGSCTKAAHCSSNNTVGMQRANSTAYGDARVGRNGKVFDPNMHLEPSSYPRMDRLFVPASTSTSLAAAWTARCHPWSLF